MQALVLAGSQIRERDDLLCLTDMWRAAGSDPNKRPAKWLAQDGPQEFIRCVGANLNIPLEDIAVAERGGRDPASWAHWHVALAYAYYLSPDFHMECNEIIRAHFERRHSGGLVSHVIEQLQRSVERTCEVAQRTYEVAKDTGGKVVQLLSTSARIEQRMNDVIPRNEPSEKNKRIYLYTIKQPPYNGYCPCGCRQKILDDNGNILLDENNQPMAVPDHWYTRERNGLKAMWIVHRKCNQLLKDDDFRKSKLSRFDVFQDELDAVKDDVPKVPKIKDDDPNQIKMKFD
jgi:hypothetical protein